MKYFTQLPPSENGVGPSYTNARSFSKHEDDDGHENVKNRSETTSNTLLTLCWHIFLPLLHERPNAPLQRRKHTTTKFLCISKHGPQKFNSRKNQLLLIAMKLERWPIHFISDIFVVVAVLVSCGRVTAKFTCLSPSKSRNFTEGRWLGKGAQTFFQRSKVQCKNFATFLSFQQITLMSFTFLFGFQGAKRQREIFAREETENKKLCSVSHSPTSLP